jgi:hypothetical protein
MMATVYAVAFPFDLYNLLQSILSRFFLFW